MGKALLAAVIFGAVLAATPANADHDMVYAPCDPEDTRSVDERVWYIDYQSGVILRYDDPWWGERPGMMGYTNWHFQCGLGMTGVWQAAPILPQPHPPDYVIDTRSPAVVCDVATGYTRMGAVEIEQRVNALIPDGIDLNSLTITDTGIIIAGTPSPLLFEAGIIREWAIDHNGTSRHYRDLYWEYKFTHLPSETFWEAGCTTAPPPTTTTTTTTTVPAGANLEATPTSGPPPPTTTQAAPVATPDSDPPVTTTTLAVDPPAPDESAPVTTTTQAPTDSTSAPLPPGYDLFTAQYEGWPFYETIILLEERYPQGTPGKYHFRLSAAVEFLRQDGMIGALDATWNSGG